MQYKKSLNGDWFYIKDKDDQFSIKDIKAEVENDRLEDTMNIPSNWQLEGLDSFNGSVWFIKKFELESNSFDDLKILKFFGVDYFSEIWLNWNFLGKHEGYFQPFIFDASACTDLVKSNILIVKVSSPFEDPETHWPQNKQLIKGIFNHHDCRPGATTKEFGQDCNTGGIWNDVEFYCGRKVFIESLRITPKLQAEKSKAKVFIDLKYVTSFHEAEKTEIQIKVKDPLRKVILTKKESVILSKNGKCQFVINIENPELWNPWEIGEANIYSVTIDSSSFEKQTEKFGFREVSLNEKEEFSINGKRLFLRGTNIIPTQYLSELTNSKIKKLVTLMREGNINIVRVHAHVNRKEFYEECDKQGLLVWQDFSLQWGYDTSDEFAVNAVRQIKEMVSLLYNFPSIVFWCCHNEPGVQINTLDELLYDAVLSEDRQRIIRKASNYEEHPYDGWYWGNYEHFAATPMGPMVTEFGAQALPIKKSLERFISKDKLFPPDIKTYSYHDFQPDQTFNIAKIDMGNSINEFIENSQNYQSDLTNIAVHFYRREKNKSIGGIFQFMFVDCWPSITWSVVDYYLEKKKAYHTLKEAYSPLLLSVDLRQDQYFQGAKLNFNLWIINDLHQDFTECSIMLYINNKEIGKVNKELIKADSIDFTYFKNIEIRIPENIKPDTYELKAILFLGNNEVISENKFDIKIVENLIKN